MSDIAQAREILEALLARLNDASDAYWIDETLVDVRRALKLMRREPAKRRAKRRSRPMTPALKAAIRAYARATPNASVQEMGDMFRVNQGRVSEALP